MLSINNVEICFDGIDLFSDVSFLIKPKDRIGLTGMNGAGKTTLMKLMAGELNLANGEISKPADCSIAYLPQHIQFSDAVGTVKDETLNAFPEILSLQHEIEQLNEELVQRSDCHSEEYHNITIKLAEYTERLSFLNADTIHADVERTLTGLGFCHKDLSRNIRELSGGWRMRVELSKLLLQQPDVLLLDEPTNHLDIESIQWLESFLINYKGAVVIISHDRLLLDNITYRTLELDQGKLYDYPVAFSKFQQKREERVEKQKAERKNQQKQIEETEQFIERFRYKATKAKQVQSRIKQLEKLNLSDIEEPDSSTIHFRFPDAPRSGSIVAEAKNLSKAFDDNLVFKHCNLIIERGEKVALVGKNGEGKTTFSKILLGLLNPSGGLVKTGHNLHIGYYAQNQDELLDNHKTVFQTLDDEAKGEVRKNIRTILGSFLFSGDDINKPVSVLSGGERSRLALAKLLLEPYNLLVLDEPTNHLDIQSKDVLKNALKSYNGTLIVVSHDRYFLDGLVDVVYEFRKHNIHQHLGGIHTFLRHRKLESLREIESINKIKSKNNNRDDKMSANKARYLKQKEQEKARRKILRQIKETENKIEQTENRLSELEHILSHPEQLEDSHPEEYNKLKNQLDNLMDTWEHLQQQL
ncbi:MAG: ABC-F family ATP-binding cassette domain-containing protein [Candidatus Delongbacteria bacterium]|jgi:ATP-binding cassette subfamily F protein 3|nr:ABC-F family ATP-binding cassette domain-containing protein [Candidatus Delongbacteria bacterium]